MYYVGHMLEYAGAGTFEGKRVAISGSGNVAQYAALKLIELGAKVVSLSDSKGCFVAEGDAVVTPEDVSAIAALKVERKELAAYEHGGKFKYIEGARPWVHVGKVDVALPCATQNEVSKEEAEALVGCGAKFIAEGSNMGCTQEAIDVFESERKTKKAESIWYAPGKASNCGGVAVSGLEMAQNSQVGRTRRFFSPSLFFSTLLSPSPCPCMGAVERAPPANTFATVANSLFFSLFSGSAGRKRKWITS